MKSKRRPYRKHKVKIDDSYISVKDWMRDNQNLFANIKGVPTSEQIGKVLILNGFKRSETTSEVLYK
tara:strand:- start:1169 stop:1369 length:201 start_codon:yes stop_codon:yes gene_type:complete